MFAPFAIGLALVALAECVLRVLDGTKLFATPARYGVIYADAKRDAFLHAFLPKVKENPSRPGMLILGSSTADTNLDPSTMRAELAAAGAGDHAIFNGGMYAVRLDDARFLQQWYRKRWKYSELVIGIEPGILRPGRLPNMQETMGANSLEQWLRDHSMLYALRGQLRAWKPDEPTVLFDAEVTAEGWNRTLVWTNPQSPEQQVRGATAHMNEWKIDWSLARQMAAAAQREGVQVTWLLMPYRDDMMRGLPAEWSFDRIARDTRALAAEHGQRYLDFSAVRLPDSEFFDPTHYNARGAKAMSALVGRRLGEMIAQRRMTHVEPPHVLQP